MFGVRTAGGRVMMKDETNLRPISTTVFLLFPLWTALPATSTLKIMDRIVLTKGVRESEDGSNQSGSRGNKGNKIENDD